MKTARLFTLSLICFLGLGLFLASPVSADLDCRATDLTPVEQVQCGVEATNPNVDGENSDQAVINTVSAAINILSIVVGVIAVIVIIIQGMRMILSGGNEKTTKEARSGIIYALVGLTIAVLAQSIVHFVLNRIG